MPLEVGILGSGAGVAALHLAVLDGLPELFAVAPIADAGSGRARVPAERSGDLGGMVRDMALFRKLRHAGNP